MARSMRAAERWPAHLMQAAERSWRAGAACRVRHVGRQTRTRSYRRGGERRCWRRDWEWRWWRRGWYWLWWQSQRAEGLEEASRGRAGGIRDTLAHVSPAEHSGGDPRRHPFWRYAPASRRLARYRLARAPVRRPDTQALSRELRTSLYVSAATPGAPRRHVTVGGRRGRRGRRRRQSRALAARPACRRSNGAPL